MWIITRYPYCIRVDLDADKDSILGIWYPRGYDMDTICYLISADMPQSSRNSLLIELDLIILETRWKIYG